MQGEIDSQDEVSTDLSVVLVIGDDDPLNFKILSQTFNEDHWNMLMYTTTDQYGNFNAEPGDVLLFENGFEIKRSHPKEEVEIWSALNLPVPHLLI